MQYEKGLKTASLAALFSLFYTATAQAIYIDLSGVTVDGGAPTEITVLEDETFLDGTLIDIYWDFGVVHTSPSWGSETDININNGWLDPTDVFIDGEADCGFNNFSGLHECSGSATVAAGSGNLFPGDVWTITLTDSFDDGPNPDYTFTDGSYIAWGDDVPGIPAPATLALVGLGVLLVSGFSRNKKST